MFYANYNLQQLKQNRLTVQLFNLQAKERHDRLWLSYLQIADDLLKIAQIAEWETRDFCITRADYWLDQAEKLASASEK